MRDDSHEIMLTLSKPAQRLWERVRNPSNYYPRKFPAAGKYMQELIDARLVVHGARVQTIAGVAATAAAGGRSARPGKTSTLNGCVPAGT